MTRIGIRELRNSLSRVIRTVAEGGSVDVTDHGRVVARLSPPAPSEATTIDPLDALIAAGLLTPPTAKGKAVLKWPTVPRPSARRGLAAKLIDEDRAR